jgi:hypothetical protein
MEFTEKNHRPRTQPEQHEKYKRIKIIKTPPGEVPEPIRQEWVGVIIPLADSDSLLRYTMGTAGGEPQNQDGYEVLFTDAVKALYQKCERLFEEGNDSAYDSAYQAYQVWLNSRWNQQGMRLQFKKDCCALVE